MGTLIANRLLVVEDHPWVLQTLCGALRRPGSHIESATTLRAARRRILEDDPYDAVICEHHLSDGTGMALLGWLRWQQQIPVPFLLIARRDRLIAQRGDDFEVLAPPLGQDRLLASLNSLLRHETEGMLICQIPFAAEVEIK
jgi:DNA-binding response OmpR family regulator